MMRQTIFIFALILAHPALALESSVTVDHAWARATAPAAKVGGVFLTMTDAGGTDRLVGASSPVGEKAELHETIKEGNVMRMRPVAGVPLEPGKPVTLKPGGIHIMITGL